MTELKGLRIGLKNRFAHPGLSSWPSFVAYKLNAVAVRQPGGRMALGPEAGLAVAFDQVQAAFMLTGGGHDKMSIIRRKAHGRRAAVTGRRHTEIAKTLPMRQQRTGRLPETANKQRQAGQQTVRPAESQVIPLEGTSNQDSG